MTPWTTLPESTLCAALKLPPADGARAREVVAAVQALPLPMDLRVAVLVHLLDSPEVEVGPVYAARMLQLPPLTHLGALLQAKGVGLTRLGDIARALRGRDPAELRVAAAPPPPDGTAANGEAADGEAADGVVKRASVSAGDPQAMGLTEIATSAGRQLDAAREGLGRAQHPLRLGEVQLTLRGSLAQGEDAHLSMRFDAAALSPEAASELVLRYRLQDAEAAPTGEATVPDVLGYTQALAQRKLKSAGLSAAAVHVLTDDPRQRGRVLRQRPAAGQALPRGQAVTLQLGRPPSTELTP